ncbi:CBO0543 family protein [Salicibibacter kimchii]|uniref:Uncharacterized protein n=1 Tax=Salicibibacter kimchii TaxID=2099786 RepID=A0A345C292_9BACI|nr:CBO0543 family protein [Salicibibacter kimchii]AXF57323.1 hypothetical protein DT065_15825 [Salicibibacter kimchii]
MQEDQQQQLEILRSANQQLTQMQMDYWQSFSHPGTWQFWFEVGIIVIPLVVLFFAIDRSKAFLLGFFGFNYHAWFLYADRIMIEFGLWDYPYQFVPFLPSFGVDASFVPVLFMLLYQWTLKNNKNVYLYGLLLSAILGFVFGPILMAMDFFRPFYGINLFHLFVFYYLLFIISMIFTNIFIWLKKNA